MDFVTVFSTIHLPTCSVAPGMGLIFFEHLRNEKVFPGVMLKVLLLCLSGHNLQSSGIFIQILSHDHIYFEVSWKHYGSACPHFLVNTYTSYWLHPEPI